MHSRERIEARKGAKRMRAVKRNEQQTPRKKRRPRRSDALSQKGHGKLLGNDYLAFELW